MWGGEGGGGGGGSETGVALSHGLAVSSGHVPPKIDPACNAAMRVSDKQIKVLMVSCHKNVEKKNNLSFSWFHKI